MTVRKATKKPAPDPVLAEVIADVKQLGREIVDTEAASLRDIIARYKQRFEPRVALASLHSWPGNPKDHDIGAIVESMRENGIIGVLYVQESTRRVMAGHGRMEALDALGVKEMDCIFVDCPAAVAKRFVLADNRLSQLGGYRDDMLYDYLRGMTDAGESLAGTGFATDDVDELREMLESAGTTDTAVPAAAAAEAARGDQWICVVSCENELQLSALYERLQREGYQCKLVT